MKRSLLVANKKFWTMITSLLELDAPVLVDDICKEINVGIEELFQAILFLHNLSYEIQIDHTQNQTQLIPPRVKGKINLEFTLAEWLAFQAHLPLLDKYSGKAFHQTLVDKIALTEQKYPEYDLFNAELCSYSSLQQIWNECSTHKGIGDKKQTQIDFNELRNLIIEIESAILNGHKVIILTEGEHKKEIYPHRLIKSHGRFSLIAEDCLDQTLLSLDLSFIKFIQKNRENNYAANFSIKEVSDFIHALHSLDENNIRLILKFRTLDVLVPPPSYYYLGNPYLTIRPNGEVIWAATIEKNSEIFDWLAHLDPSTEILSPEGLKIEIHQNFNKKLKKAG